MRSEMKIAIAVGLLLMVAVVAYVVLLMDRSPTQDRVVEKQTPRAGEGPADQGNPPPESVVVIPGSGTDANAGETVLPGTVEPFPPAGEALIIEPGPAAPSPEPDGGDTAPDSLVLVPKIDDTPPRKEDLPPTPEVLGGEEIPVDTEVEIIPVGVGPALGGDPVIPVVPPDPSVVGAEAGLYKVKKADTLWTIAEARYGHGKYWEHIAKANPAIEPSKISEGMTLKVPPLAGQETRTAAGDQTHGTVVSRAGGEKIYVVKKGDNGFWSVAAKPEVYGDGRYWHLIQKANPDAKTGALRPGQQLIIPPLDTAVRAPGRAPGAVSRAPTLTEPGTYIVREGDNGLAAIAKKVYRDSTFWPAIQKANPDAESTRLRVGQELIIPSFSEAKRLVGS